jgi:hypothetical protein
MVMSGNRRLAQGYREQSRCLRSSTIPHNPAPDAGYLVLNGAVHHYSQIFIV